MPVPPSVSLLIRRLASLRLTLALLFLLAAVAALGSALPSAVDPAVWQQRYGTDAPWWQSLGRGGVFTSWWFRGLWGVLLLNLLACGVRRSVQGVRDVFGWGRPAAHLPGEARHKVAEVLALEGFRVVAVEPLVARRRSWGFLGFPLVHLSPVLIVGGALWGSWGGFVGTTYGFLNTPTWSFFNWSAGEDQHLPFALVVEDVRFVYHPLQLRVGLGDPERGGRLVETREGASFSADPAPYRVEVVRLDVETRDLQFYLDGPGGRLGPYSSVQGNAPLRVVPVAFRDPELRQVEAAVTARGEDNRVLARHTLAVNHPLDFGGVRLYLTAWSDAGSAEPWLGVQIVHDPGQLLLWSGSSGLAVGLMLLLFVRGGWAREEAGELLLKADRAVLSRVRAAASCRAD